MGDKLKHLELLQEWLDEYEEFDVFYPSETLVARTKAYIKLVRDSIVCEEVRVNGNG